MDINIRKIDEREKFQDARPKIQEVAVRVSLPKALFYWTLVSRWAFILLAALAPIFFMPFTSLPVAVHKELLVFALVLIAFFALLGRILIEGRIRIPGYLFTAALSVLVLVWGISSFFSVNQIGSLIGSWAAPDSFADILLFAILTLSVVMAFNRRDIIVSLSVFLVSLSILGIFELLQLMKVFVLPFIFTKNAAFNPIGSVNDLGVLLAFGLIIASGLMSSFEISKLLKRLLGLAVIIFILNLIIIDFWAIWVGLALAMVFMISFLSVGLRSISEPPSSIRRIEEFPEGEGMVRRIIPGGSEIPGYQGLQLAYFQRAWLLSIVLLVSLLFLFIPSPLARFIQTPVEVSPSFRATLDIGTANLKAGNYLLGSGPNTWGAIFNLYKPQGINQTIFWSTVFSNGASAMANWLGTVGILGVLALLFLIAAFIWTGIKFRMALSVASQAVLVAVFYLFIMWFLYAANFTVMAFTFWASGLFLAASRSIPGIEPAYRPGRESAPQSRGGGRILGINNEIRIFTSPPKTFIFSLLIVALMVGAAIGVYFEINRYVAEIYFGKALAASAKNDNRATINNISRAIQFWQYDERYFQSLAQATFLQLNDLLAKKDLPQETLRAQFQNITTGAISASRQAQVLNPHNPFNSVLLGSIYENLIPFIADAANFALSAYGGAASLDPQNPSNYLALARVEIAQADLAVNNKKGTSEISGYLDKAAFNLEKSIGLKNDYAPSRFLLVQVYDREGKLNDAVKKAEELVTLNNQDVGALFQLGFLYYKAGRYDDSKIVFERTIELSPNYSNARYFLGLMYDRNSLGMSKDDFWAAKDKARKQFEKIAELNPDNNEIKQIVANLKAGKAALFGIAPPLLAPQNRAEAPVSEGTKAPVQKLKR